MEEPRTNETVPIIAKIGTDNFIGYLVNERSADEGLLRRDLDDFERQIIIPEEIHQAIKEMHEQQREGRITGPIFEVEKSELAAEMDKLSQGLGKTFMNKEPEVGSLEQVRVISVDENNGGLKSSTSTYGFGTEIGIYEQLQKAAAENSLPIIVIHTHPRDANFSFRDYSLMLIGESSEKDRLLKAIMVLLPNMQIMAVATDDTPIFTDYSELDKFISSHTVEMNQKGLELLRDSLSKLKTLNDRRRLIGLIEMLKKTLGEKYKEMVGEGTKQFSIKEGESTELQTKISEEITRVSDESARVINSALIDFGRQLNVKLYFSHDMRTFREFSA